MYCHTISPGSYISWHKGAAHPLPPTVFSLHSPPPLFISHPCLLYCALLACDRIFLVSPIPFFVPVSQRGCGFWRQCSKFNLQRDFFTFYVRYHWALFNTFFKDDSPHCVDFPALFLQTKVRQCSLQTWLFEIVSISQIFADSSQFCKCKF